MYSPSQWCPVVCMAQHRPGAEQLIQAEGPMEDVVADQPEGALEIELAQDLAP